MADEKMPAAEGPAAPAKTPTISRRTLCWGIGAVAATLGLGALKYVPATPVVRPPGGQDEALMLANCIHCQKCYEVCPHHVIRPAHLEDGILAARTPEMDFSADYCTFCAEENSGHPLCVQVCPTGCFSLPEGATPETTIIGAADLEYDLCLAYMMIGCRFCYDACPYEAIELDEYNRPHVIADRCNGCGACESVCVSQKNASLTARGDRRAIVVQPIAGGKEA